MPTNIVGVEPDPAALAVFRNRSGIVDPEEQAAVVSLIAAPEEGVSGLAQHEQDHHEEGTEQDVEPGYDVGTDDLAGSAARPLGDPVDPSRPDSLPNLGIGQTALGGSQLEIRHRVELTVVP